MSQSILPIRPHTANMALKNSATVRAESRKVYQTAPWRLHPAARLSVGATLSDVTESNSGPVDVTPEPGGIPTGRSYNTGGKLRASARNTTSAESNCGEQQGTIQITSKESVIRGISMPTLGIMTAISTAAALHCYLSGADSSFTVMFCMASAWGGYQVLSHVNDVSRTLDTPPVR